MSLPAPHAVEEIPACDVTEARLHADDPWVARGLANDWPLVLASRDATEFAQYLSGFYSGKAVCAFLGEPAHKGRFFYVDLSHLVRR